LRILDLGLRPPLDDGVLDSLLIRREPVLTPALRRSATFQEAGGTTDRAEDAAAKVDREGACKTSGSSC
jgi:hypothetical protein